MPEDNALKHLFPQIVRPVNEDRTTISEYVEKRQGEVQLDQYVRAQSSAPEVVKRITELENCVWRLADAIAQTVKLEAHHELRAVVEQAQLILKNRLEIDETNHRFTSELGPFTDDMSLFKG
jgi:hypothetical protein